MTKTTPAALAALLLVSANATTLAYADDPEAELQTVVATDVSLGVVMGEPTGISGRLGFGHSAVVLAAGVDFDEHVHAHADFQRNVAYLMTGGSATIPIYFGLGVFVKDHPEDIAAHGGARIPIGVQIDFAAPVQLYGELVPNVVLVEPDQMYPHQTVTLNGALGVRARF